MTWHFIAGFLAGFGIGHMLWRWFLLPAVERKHLAEVKLHVARARLEKVRTARGIFGRGN